VLNFIAIDLQLYKIFKIMQVSVFGTQCRKTFSTKITLLQSTCLWTCSVSGKDDGGEVHLKTPRPDKPHFVSAARRSAGRMYDQIWQGPWRRFTLWYVVHDLIHSHRIAPYLAKTYGLILTFLSVFMGKLHLSVKCPCCST